MNKKKKKQMQIAYLKTVGAHEYQRDTNFPLAKCASYRVISLRSPRPVSDRIELSIRCNSKQQQQHPSLDRHSEGAVERGHTYTTIQWNAGLLLTTTTTNQSQ